MVEMLHRVGLHRLNADDKMLACRDKTAIDYQRQSRHRYYDQKDMIFSQGILIYKDL